VTAVLVQGLWGAALLGIVALSTAQPQDVLGFLLDGVVFVDWLFYGLCGAALLRLRRRGESDGFRAPGGGLVAALFVAFALIVTVGAVVGSPGPSLVGAGLCLVGLGAWWGFSRGAPGGASS